MDEEPIKNFEGDTCPNCHEAKLETYNNDKANTIVLFCPACDAVIDEAEQEEP